MAKSRVRVKQLRPLTPILKSPELEEILLEQGLRVEEAASSDPSPEYVATLDTHVFESEDRNVVQVGAAPGIGTAVEAKRGTLARALGSLGA